MIVRIPLIAAVSTLALAACGQPKTETDVPADTTASTVERVSPTTTAPAAPAPTTAAIQTQPAADGVQVALNRVQVTGDVLTVQTTFTNPGTSGAGMRFSVEEVSVIDDTTAQRYGVLRDATGRWQASPLQDATSNFVSFGVSQGGGSEVVWFKFPAPPATSQTVSINIPGVGPFDGVPVTR
ncbi:hypothetical protein [Brevundimonas sp.]|uniref:hypothetical protein n=1 Tax=Brevundimonas sp. TaxID=1871086 RepID=UPI003D0F84DC